MKCLNCNGENLDSNNYCGSCGTILSSNLILDTKSLENTIAAILQKQLKDRQVVEVEMTENIVSKIASWAKLFAYFIGIPFAIVIFILGFLGYNSYSSFTKLIQDTEKTVRPQIEQAKVRVDSLNLEAEALKNNFEKYKELDRQVANLTKTVNIIAEKFNVKGVSGDKKGEIESSLNSFQNYLQNLGYNPIGREVFVSIESLEPSGTIFYYDRENNTMHIDSSYSDDLDLFFRQYMHRVLYSKIEKDSLPAIDRKSWYYSIQSGLAFYFPCSFRNSPLFASTSAQKGKTVSIDFSKKLLFHTPKDWADAMYDVANAWSSAFWEMRQTIGKEITDKLLYDSWMSISVPIWQNNSPWDFVNILINEDRKMTGGKNRNILKEIFINHSLK